MKSTTFSLLLSCSLVVGSILHAAPGKQITVKGDETVYGIAHEHGIRTQTLIQANNLTPPYVLKKGQVLRIPSANEHVVRNGENLHSIAEDYGINPDVLAQENDVHAPYFIKDGDSLLIPPPDTESMAEALKPPSEDIAVSSLAPLPQVKSEPAPGRPHNEAHRAPSPVGLPDDLARELAQEKGSDNSNAATAAVAAGAISGISAVGETSNIVDNSINRPAIMGNLAEGKTGKQASTAPLPVASLEDVEEQVVKPTKKEKRPEAKTVKKEEKEEKKTKQVQFIKPVEGEVITKFKAGVNDGINIAVPEGTSVKAAGAGEVMYAGNELKGLGELLLLKHKDGWMTAYAHNSELLVKKGDTVKQGQVIAKSGKTGDVKKPQLHFEVRKGKQPVDPLPKLGS